MPPDPMSTLAAQDSSLEESTQKSHSSQGLIGHKIIKYLPTYLPTYLP